MGGKIAYRQRLEEGIGLVVGLHGWKWQPPTNFLLGVCGEFWDRRLVSLLFLTFL